MHFEALIGDWFPHPRALLAGVALLSALVLLEAAGVPVLLQLRYARAPLAAGQWWRLLSAHLVHSDARHLALNLGGLALLWSLYVRDASVREWLIVTLAGMLAIDAGLYVLDPAVGWYVGASGALHAIWAAAGVFAARRWRLEGLVTLALLGAKLAIEQRYGALSAQASAFPVVTSAHLYGALGGLAAALGLRLARAPL